MWSRRKEADNTLGAWNVTRLTRPLPRLPKEVPGEKDFSEAPIPDRHSDCGGHFVDDAAPDSLVYCLDLGILSPDLLLCSIRVKRQFIPDTAQGMVQPTVKMASQIN